MSKRDHNGYLQIQNQYERIQPDGSYKFIKKWEYVVLGFFDNETMAHVALFNGGEVGHPIDKKDRLTVRTGMNKYSKTKAWYH